MTVSTEERKEIKSVTLSRNVRRVLRKVFSQSPLPNKLKTPKKRYGEGVLQLNAVSTLMLKDGKEVILKVKGENTLNAETIKLEEGVFISDGVKVAMEEVFKLSPLPNKLKAPKQRFASGKLRINALTSILGKYSDAELILKQKGEQ